MPTGAVTCSCVSTLCAPIDSLFVPRLLYTTKPVVVALPTPHTFGLLGCLRVREHSGATVPAEG